MSANASASNKGAPSRTTIRTGKFGEVEQDMENSLSDERMAGSIARAVN
jgi:hypothetical protein